MRIALTAALAALLGSAEFLPKSRSFRFLAIFGGNSGKFTYIRMFMCVCMYCLPLWNNSGRLGRKYSHTTTAGISSGQQLCPCMCGGAAAVGGQCNCEFAKCIGLRGRARGRGTALYYSRRARAFITLKNKSDFAMSQGTIMSVSINNGLSTVNNVS